MADESGFRCADLGRKDEPTWFHTPQGIRGVDIETGMIYDQPGNGNHIRDVKIDAATGWPAADLRKADAERWFTTYGRPVVAGVRVGPGAIHWVKGDDR